MYTKLCLRKSHRCLLDLNRSTSPLNAEELFLCLAIGRDIFALTTSVERLEGRLYDQKTMY